MLFAVCSVFNPKWVIPGVLATSPMPCGEDVNVVSKMFRCVVVLAKGGELCYDVSALVSRGVKVLHRPASDFKALNLVDIHDAADSFCNKPVLASVCVWLLGLVLSQLS